MSNHHPDPSKVQRLWLVFAEERRLQDPSREDYRKWRGNGKPTWREIISVMIVRETTRLKRRFLVLAFSPACLKILTAEVMVQIWGEN